MTSKAFSATAGARPQSEGHPRVGIVVTDGQSDYPTGTTNAAMKAHNDDITMFVVGKHVVTSHVY